MSNQFQSVILTISKVVAAGKATTSDIRAVEEQGIPLMSLLDEYLGGADSITATRKGEISATIFVTVLANYVGNIGTLVIPDKAVEWAGDNQDDLHNHWVFNQMPPVIVSKDETGMEKQITEIINLRSTLADRDESIRRVRKAMLDEGVHPPFHRRQVERLRQEWPTLYNAIMGLVKP